MRNTSQSANRDAANDDAELAGAGEILLLRDEVRSLRDEICNRLPQPPAT